MLSNEVKRAYTEILKEELHSAMGCTEPIAIAYAASIVTELLAGAPEELSVGLSANIIKNVKSVIVPATGGMSGIESALAAGVISASPWLRLEVLSVLGDGDIERIREYKANAKIQLRELKSPCTFDLCVDGKRGNSKASVRISGGHTDVVLAELDGISVLEGYAKRGSDGKLNADGGDDHRGLLNVKDIVEFADTVDLCELRPYIQKQIELNSSISEEGIRNTYGASIGRLMLERKNVDTPRRAAAYAAAGSDARMSGCELPVCILSGSGNQGITASVPVIVYARENGIDEETLYRALIVSDLVTVHQKSGIGCLSAYCGAVSAGCGCGAGIAYLFGGRYYEIAHTVVNAVAILSGTICDGAKPSCAAKIAMAVEAGIMGYEMAATGRQFYGGDGIVTKGVENTIRNVGRLARDGMGETDKEIIRIMLED